MYILDLQNKITEPKLYLIGAGANSKDSSLIFNIGINDNKDIVFGLTSFYKFKFTFLRIRTLFSITKFNNIYNLTYPYFIVNTGILYKW